MTGHKQGPKQPVSKPLLGRRKYCLVPEESDWAAPSPTQKNPNERMISTRQSPRLLHLPADLSIREVAGLQIEWIRSAVRPDDHVDVLGLHLSDQGREGLTRQGPAQT